jgi:hypothetical protein
VTTAKVLAWLILAAPLALVGIAAVWAVHQFCRYRRWQRHMAELRRLPPKRIEPRWMRDSEEVRGQKSEVSGKGAGR